MLRRLGSSLIGCLLLAFGACARANVPDDEGEPLSLPDRVPATDGQTVLGEDGAVEDAFVPPVDGGDGGDAGPTDPKAFVSSTTHNARYGGLAGADKLCADLAKAAGLAGTWVAWLSNQGGPHAVDRVTSAGPYRLVGTGEIIASTKAELVGGTLKHVIDRDENGAAVAGTAAWTGTGANGKYETNDCDKWTTGNNGRTGRTDQSDSRWTSNNVNDCDQLHRLYCFQN